jgi:hypothetical protein
MTRLEAHAYNTINKEGGMAQLLKEAKEMLFYLLENKQGKIMKDIQNFYPEMKQLSDVKNVEILDIKMNKENFWKHMKSMANLASDTLDRGANNFDVIPVLDMKMTVAYDSPVNYDGNPTNIRATRKVDMRIGATRVEFLLNKLFESEWDDNIRTSDMFL